MMKTLCIKKENIEAALAFATMFYVMFKGILNAIFGNIGVDALYLITGIELLIFIIDFCVNKKRIKKKQLLPILHWGVFVLYILVDKQQFVAKWNSFTTFSLLLGFFWCVVFTLSNSDIEKAYIAAIKFCTKIHAIATILCFVFPQLYLRLIFPLFPYNIKQELVDQINSGCVPGLTQHYSTNGIYLAYGVMLFAIDSFVINSQLKRDKIWMLITILALILTGKRGQLIFAVMSVVIVYYVCNKSSSNVKILNSLLVIMGILLVGVVLSDVLVEVSTTFARFKMMTNASDVTNGRLYFYEFAFKWFKEAPVFGIGWEGFKYKLNLTIGKYCGIYEYMNCHNVYLQVLCELGVVGELIFLSRLGIDLKTYIWGIKWKILEDNRIKYMLSASMAIYFFFVFYCITGNPLYDLEVVVPFLCFASIVYKHIECQKM